MVKKLFSSFLIMLFIACSELMSQSINVAEVLDTATIDQQFKHIFERSSRYEEYKVIRETWLTKYQKNLSDTIQNIRKTLTDNRLVISEKNNEIESLQNKLSAAEDELQTAIKEKNSLLFLGIKMDKTFYNLIMWLLVAALLFLLVILSLVYKRSQTTTKETLSSLDQIRGEYDEYRNQSRIKMEKIKREHLDEILKLKSGH